MAQVPECVVCLQPYDDFLHVPRVLACGHSFCELCLMQLQSAWQSSSSSNNNDDDSRARPASGAVIRCPECSHRTRLPIGGQQSLPKNVELLRLLPSLIREPADSVRATDEASESSASLKGSAEKSENNSIRAARTAPGRRDHLNLAADGGAVGIRSSYDSGRPPKAGGKGKQRVDPNCSLGTLSGTSTSNSIADSWLLPCELYSNNSNSNSNNNNNRKNLRTWILPEKAIKLRGEEDSTSSSSRLRPVDSSSQNRELLWGEIILEQDRLSSSIPVRLQQLREVSCPPHPQSHPQDDETTPMSYEDSVLKAWEACHYEVKTELFILFRVSLLSRGLCTVLGVWMNPQRNALFLVTQIPTKEEPASAWEMIKTSFQSAAELSAQSKTDEQSASGQDAIGLSSAEEMAKLKLCEGPSPAQKFSSSVMNQTRLSKVGLELCGILFEVHSQGFIFGLLSPNCFVLDGFGSLLIDVSEAMNERSSLREATSRLSGVSSECGPEEGGCGSGNNARVDFDGQTKNYRNFCWRYMSPEALSLLISNTAKEEGADRTTDTGDGSSSSCGSNKVQHRITCQTDAWSLGCLLLELVSGKAPYYRYTLPEVIQKVLVEREKPGDFLSLLYSSTHHCGTDCDAHGKDGNLSPIKSLAILLSKCFEYDPDERPDLDVLRRNLMEVGWSKLTPMTSSIPPVQNLQSEQAGTADQKFWVLCLPGFMRDGYLDSWRGREADAQESQRGLEHLRLYEGAADKGRDVQPCGLEQKGSLEGHRDYVTALAVCGDHLLSASFDKTIRVWSLEDNELQQTLEGHSIVVMALAVDHSTSRCFSGDTGGKICAWKIGEDIAEPLLATWQDHDDWRYTGVASLAVSADEILYSGSGDRTIKAWSLQNFAHLGTMEGHKGLVTALLVDGELLYSGSWDGTIRVWWRNDQSLVAVLGDGPTSIPSLGGVRTLCMSDSFLFAGRDSGDIQVWRDEQCLTTVKAHDMVVSSLYVEGDFLYTGSWDEQIKAWEVEKFLSHPSPSLVKKCGFALSSIVSDGDQLYAGLADREVKVYSLLGDTWASLVQML